MPISAHKNFALSTMASPPSSTDGTSLTVATGTGTRFPAVPFNATLWPASVQPTTANAEIVRVTNISTDVFTVARAQEGSTARTHAANDQISATITARTLTDAEYGAHKVANVMDPAYGAVGDGITDDTAAVQAAIDAVEALSGGELYFPKGTFKVTAELTVTQPMVIRGAGRGIAIVRATTLGANKAVFKVTSGGVFFRDLTIRGPSVATYVSEEYGIWFYGTSGTPLYDGGAERVEVYDIGSFGVGAEFYHRVTVRDCWVHDVGYGGIWSFSANLMGVFGNLIEDITPGTGGNAYGVALTHRAGAAVPSGFRVVGNHINNVLIWEAIDTHGGTDGTIADNVITNCKLGINVSPSNDNAAPHRITVCGNTIVKGAGVSTAHRAIGSGGYDTNTRATGIVCTGNSVTDMGNGLVAADGAILWQFCSALVCSGNTITNAQQNGLVFSTCDAMAVHGNTVDNVANITSNSAGVRFDTACTGVMTGNWLDATDNYPLNFNAACPDLRMDDTNVLITDGTPPASGALAISPANAGRGYTRQATATFNPSNLVDGAGETTTVTANGAALGDYAEASFSLDLQGITLTAWVSATNTVSVRFQNESGGAVDLASGTLTVRAIRP